ncbi:Gfo/Idh/MocA family protein [Planctomycetota bacterium]
MASAEYPLRVAILGASGIGRVHARIFSEQGANVCAVLGSSDASAERAAQGVGSIVGRRPESFSDLESLILQARPQAVAICTPPHLHAKQLCFVFDRGLPAFCEKPLVQIDPQDQPTFDRHLNMVVGHPNRRLFVNTSNVTFMEAVIQRLELPKQASRFSFRFATRGTHKGRDIGFDLSPHGFSLMLPLFGKRPVDRPWERTSENAYQCGFTYGACQVTFDFEEDPNGPKGFAFAIDGRTFTRVQEGSGPTYRVFLQDGDSGERFEVEDPFRAYIRNFRRYCQDGAAALADEGLQAASIMSAGWELFSGLAREGG